MFLRRAQLHGVRTLRSLWLSATALVLLSLFPATASAQRSTTQDAFDRLEEILEIRQEDGLLDSRDVVPTLLVSAKPRYSDSAGWFRTRGIAALVRVFGEGTVRVCEACMLPRTDVQGGTLLQNSGAVSLDEVAAMDDRYRGDSARAKTAIWLEESATGLSIRIVDLRSAGILFAQNVDPTLREYEGSARTFRLSEELERRTRGESLTHAVFDLALLPNQHITFEWLEQWGESNSNLTGIVLSAFDPVFGVGLAYHRVLEWQHITVGLQGIVSIPTAAVQATADTEAELLDPLLTGAVVARCPLFFKHSNYAAVLTASTNGRVGIGFSFLNTSFIPILP